MSAVIAMNNDIEFSIKEMCTDAMIQTVMALSEKYGFDEEEAKEFLMLEKIQIIRKRGPSPKPVKSEVKKTDKSDKPKIKRGMSGYNLFNKVQRGTVVAELEKASEESGEKFKTTNVMSALGAQWSALSDDDKMVWNNKAKTINESSSDEEQIEAPEEEEKKVKEKKVKEKKVKEKKVKEKKVDEKKVDEDDKSVSKTEEDDEQSETPEE